MAATEERYPRACPVCRNAMLGERRTPDSPHFYRHICLTCGTVIEAPQSGEDDGDACKD